MAVKRKNDGTKPSLDLFMILGNILVDKDEAIYRKHIENESFASVFSTYMVLRYLSMNQNKFVRKLALDCLTTMEGIADKPELVYKTLMKVVPRTGNRFTQYIKSGFQSKRK
jgi:hypothetical protein